MLFEVVALLFLVNIEIYHFLIAFVGRQLLVTINRLIVLAQTFMNSVLLLILLILKLIHLAKYLLQQFLFNSLSVLGTRYISKFRLDNVVHSTPSSLLVYTDTSVASYCKYGYEYTHNNAK